MSGALKSCFRSWMAPWNHFWFGPRDLYVLSLFRVCLGGVLFVMYSVRFTEIELFYFNDGLVDAETAKLYYSKFNEPLFYLFPATDSLIYLFHVLFLVGLLLIALGVSHRLFVLGVFLLHLCFIERNHFIVYGADLYATFWLFFLCFMKSGSHFNFITWVGRKYFGLKKVVSERWDILTSVGVRLMQVQICITYGATGLEKLKGANWWEGSAVWYVMGNQQIVPFDFSFFYRAPVVIALMTFSVLVFEIYFPMAIWQKKLRPLWIFFGVTFHLLTSLFMGLFYFGLIMTMSYLLWLNREDCSRIFKGLVRPLVRLRKMSQNNLSEVARSESYCSRRQWLLLGYIVLIPL